LLDTVRERQLRDIMRVTGSGNLTREVELRATKSGAQLALLRVAFNTRRPDGDGGWADKPNYVDVEVWGGQAENCARYLSRGSRVFIDGELDYQEWEERSTGQKRSALRIRAQTVTFEGGAPSGDARRATAPPPPVTHSAPDPPAPAQPEGSASADDLPF
jgi:single-strand DNA-binding protein